MSIEAVPNSAFAVRDVRTSRGDTDRPYVTWGSCSGVDAYVVCAVSGSPVVLGDMVGRISDAELSALCRNGRKEVALVDGRICFLTGIAASAFEAYPRLEIDIRPPAQIQVWTVKRNYRRETLYIPELPGTERQTLPARYRFEFYAGKPSRRWKPSSLSRLVVHAENPECYEDGALCYTAGSCPPIPLPRELLDQDVPLMLLHPEDGVRVVPSKGRESVYLPY